MTPYRVKVLDAIYDEDEGFLVLLCWFHSLGAKKIVPMHKECFHYRGNEVPDIEMHRTASMFKGKEINLEIGDDPNRDKLTAQSYEDYVHEFNTRIKGELDEVCKGMSDESGQIQRKLGRMIDQGKLDVSKMVGDELSIRSRIGN